MSVTVSPSDCVTVPQSSQSLRRRLSLSLLPLMEQSARKRKLVFTTEPDTILNKVKRFRCTSAVHTFTNHETGSDLQVDYLNPSETDSEVKRLSSTPDFTHTNTQLINCDDLVRMLDQNNGDLSLLILDIRSLAAQAKLRIRGAVGIPCESRVKLRRTLPILDKYLQDRAPSCPLFTKQLVVICPEDGLDQVPAVRKLLDCMVNHIRVVHALDVRILEGGFRDFRLSYPKYCECPADILHKIQIQVKQNMTRKSQVHSTDETDPDSKSTLDSIGPISSMMSQNPLLLPGLGISPDFHTSPLNTLKKSFLRLKNEFIPDSAQPSPYPSTPFPRFTEELDSPKNIFHAQASQILPFLYLGNESDSVNEQTLNTKGIQSVLNVTLKTPFLDETRYRCCRLAVSDLPSQDLRPYFSSAFQFIEEARHSGYAILVHCQAGVSRSPAFVIAYLMAYSNLSLLQAYQLVKSKRSVISPNFAFMGQLCEFESDLLAGRASRHPDVLDSLITQDPIYSEQLEQFSQSDLTSQSSTDPDRKRTFWNHFFNQETIVS